MDPSDPAGAEFQIDWRFGETAEFELEQFGWSTDILDEVSHRQEFASIADEAADRLQR